jgi:hypothetical protein
MGEWRASGFKDGSPMMYLWSGETLRVLVHRIAKKPGTWFVSTYQVAIKDVPLQSVDLQAAKEEALALVDHRLRALSDEVHIALCATLAKEEEGCFHSTTGQPPCCSTPSG